MPPKQTHIVVQLARRATLDNLKSKLKAHFTDKKLEAVLKTGTRVSIELQTTSSLPGPTKEWIWDLYERNLKAMMEATEEGYDAQSKRKELFHTESRFVVLRASDESTNSDAELIGYSIFRFDTEETADEVARADVLYCYELQVEPSRRRSGAANLLTDLLTSIAKDWKMDKVMLTCLKSNVDALAFYEKQGFTNDEIDPSFYSQPDAEYRILSRITS